MALRVTRVSPGEPAPAITCEVPGSRGAGRRAGGFPGGQRCDGGQRELEGSARGRKGVGEIPGLLKPRKSFYRIDGRGSRRELEMSPTPPPPAKAFSFFPFTCKFGVCELAGTSLGMQWVNWSF